MDLRQETYWTLGIIAQLMSQVCARLQKAGRDLRAYRTAPHFRGTKLDRMQLLTTPKARIHDSVICPRSCQSNHLPLEDCFTVDINR